VLRPFREPRAIELPGGAHAAAGSPTLFVAARLPGAQKLRRHRIEGGDKVALLPFGVALTRLQQDGKLRAAGVLLRGRPDGLWLHRLLIAHGITAYLLEPASILVPITGSEKLLWAQIQARAHRSLARCRRFPVEMWVNFCRVRCAPECRFLDHLEPALCEFRYDRVLRSA
jgi:hypothetical protein